MALKVPTNFTVHSGQLLTRQLTLVAPQLEKSASAVLGMGSHGGEVAITRAHRGEGAKSSTVAKLKEGATGYLSKIANACPSEQTSV